MLVLLDSTEPTMTAHVPAPVFDINLTFSRCKQELVKGLLQQYKDCFSSSSRFRQTPVAKHCIVTKECVRHLCQSLYRVLTQVLEALRQQVYKMLHDKIVQPSKSLWASPVVLVKKKDGALHFCIDYQHLNKIVKKDVYRLPWIDDALYRLCNLLVFFIDRFRDYLLAN